MIKRNMHRLMNKYLAGTASTEERAFLETWVDALPATSSFLDTLTDQQMKALEKELYDGILRRIEDIRYHRFELLHHATGNLGYNPELFQEKYIELIRHHSIQQRLIRPILRADDVCFQPMLPYLSSNHRQILAWAQVEKLPLQQLAVKLRLTTSGARSRLQRAQEKLFTLVRHWCTYQNDQTGQPLSCIIHNTPGCCELSTAG